MGIFGSSSGSSGDINVRITGDASGLDAAFKQAGTSTKSFSDQLKGFGTALTAGVTLPLMAVGALALKSSSDVGGAFNLIRQKTNETGAAFESLKTSFTNVWGNVTGKAEDVAGALSLIHQKTQLTGTGLESLTTTFSQLAKITETPLLDVVQSATDAMNAWRIPTSAMSGSLDILYAVVGRTGVSITSLTSDLATLEPILNKLGFSFGASASMLGDFEVAGLDATSMNRVFSKILNQSTKDNKDATTVFWDYIDAIYNAKDGSQILTDVTTELGGTIGTKFVDAVKRGVFSLKNFKGDLQTAPDSIKRAAADTMTFSDTMEIFSHKVEIAMKPLGSAITKTFLDAKPQMDVFAGGLQVLSDKFKQLPPTAQKGIVLAGMFAAQMGPALVMLGNAMPVFDKLAIPFNTATTAAGGFVSKIVAIPSMLAGLGGKGIGVLGLALPSLATITSPLKSSEAAIGGLATKMRGLAVPVATVSTGLIGWVGNLKDAEGGVGKLKVGFGGVGSGLSVLKGGLSGLTSGISTGATGLLGMAGSVAGMVPLWAVVGGAVAAVGISLGAAYATSSRFRSLMGELGGIAAKFADHLGTAFGKLTSGDVGGALNEVKVGLQEAWNSLTKIDWRSALATIRDQMGSGIASALDQAKRMIMSVDWGGVWSGLTGAFQDAWDYLKGVDWGRAFSSIIGTLGEVWGAIEGWFRSQDWHAIGEQVGTLIGQGIVIAFQAGVNLLQLIIDSIGGAAAATGPAKEAGKTVGGGLLEGITSMLGGVGEKLQEQLGRVHIDWTGLIGDLAILVSDIGSVMGDAIYNSFATALSKVSIMGIKFTLPPIDSTASLHKLEEDAANTKLSTRITIDPDPNSIEGLKGAVLTAAKGPNPAYVTLANGDQIKLLVASASAGPHMANVYVVDPNGTINTPIAMNANGPFPSNAFVVNPDGTIRQPITTAASGPFGANVNVADGGAGVRTTTSSAAYGPHSALVNGIFGWSVPPPATWQMQVIASYSGVAVPGTPLGVGTQHGAIIGPSPGGFLVNVAEAGEIEVIVPWSKVGTPWPELISSLPHIGAIGAIPKIPKLQGGGIVGGRVGIPNFDVIKFRMPRMPNFDAPRFRTSSQEILRESTAQQRQVNYNNYINGIKMDEVVDELMYRTRIKELMLS